MIRTVTKAVMDVAVGLYLFRLMPYFVSTTVMWISLGDFLSNAGNLFSMRSVRALLMGLATFVDAPHDGAGLMIMSPCNESGMAML